MTLAQVKIVEIINLNLATNFLSRHLNHLSVFFWQHNCAITKTPISLKMFCWSTRPTTVLAGSDHYFHTGCLSVRTSQNFKIKRILLPAWTVGLAKWIMDDSCLVIFYCHPFLILLSVYMCIFSCSRKYEERNIPKIEASFYTLSLIGKNIFS